MNRVFKNEILRYSTGFLLSLILSIAAYWVVVSDSFDSYSMLVAILLVLAAIQMFVQVVLFLHVGSEPKPRWQTYSYIFTWIMLLVIVVGSIWIMRNLDYNMHIRPEQADEYMLKQAQKGF